MKLIFNVEDKPKLGQVIIFAIQQLLAIITATIVVPILVNSNGAVNLEMDPAAALLGAGVGTLVYIAFTRGKSPVFLGSSFAFLSAMFAATAFGYCGVIIGALLAGLVYVVIAVIVKLVGANWVHKLMPPVIIGPTVAIIGLSLAANAIGDMTKASATGMTYNLIAIVCGLITFAVTVLVSVKAKGMAKLIPFLIGLVAGYAAATIFTVIGSLCNVEYLKIIDYSALVNNFSPVSIGSFVRLPKFAFVEAIREIGSGSMTFTGWASLASLALLFMPVAFVVFAEHIADHKNLSTIIERDLIAGEPGLSRTLLGDGVGSMAGALFGSCPNTTYGESIGCVAITGNASVVSILTAAILAVLLAFFSPFVAFVETLPSCVMGGICMALYGFIAVSGLKMLQGVDLGESKNLFVVSAILISGIGGLTLNFGKVTITGIATALIIGILTNLILSSKKKNESAEK